MGCTLHLPPSPHDPTFTIKMAHLFIGVSVTLGVVWCNCWDRGGGTDNGIGSGSEDSQGLGSHCWFGGVGAVISGNSGDLGDDRFVGLNDEAGGVCCVINRRGRVLARLEGKVDKEAYAVIACNKKWVVRVETGESPSLMLWNVTRVATPRCGDPPPVCNGVKVERIVHMRGMGAKFPRFNDPCGDEFALLGSAEGSMCITYAPFDPASHPC
ncbi:hypothetical protein Pelo_19570 [Pelomyxa schiedti]|nr:hypothetical protein Pelo_19570 [Pelomyxa schiedti]